MLCGLLLTEPTQRVEMKRLSTDIANDKVPNVPGKILLHTRDLNWSTVFYTSEKLLHAGLSSILHFHDERVG